MFKIKGFKRRSMEFALPPDGLPMIRITASIGASVKYWKQYHSSKRNEFEVFAKIIYTDKTGSITQCYQWKDNGWYYDEGIVP